MVTDRRGHRLSSHPIMVAAGRDADVTANDLYALLPELERFHARFGRFFPRSESRSWSLKYLFGLTLPVERKNVENIAEQGGAPPPNLQHFLTNSPCAAAACTYDLQP